MSILNIFRHFSPDKLWYSAREEILFGGEEYYLRLTSEQEAHKVCKRWVSYLLAHPQGAAFRVEQHGTRIYVKLSTIGEEAAKRANTSGQDLQIIGMHQQLKADYLSRFETAVKELL